MASSRLRANLVMAIYSIVMLSYWLTPGEGFLAVCQFITSRLIVICMWAVAYGRGIGDA